MRALAILGGIVAGFLVAALTGLVIVSALVFLFYDGQEGGDYGSGAAGMGYLITVVLILVGPIASVRV